MNKYFLSGLFILTTASVYSQSNKNKGEFRDYKPGFYENAVLKGISEDEEQAKPAAKP
ncbi:MAG: hypothetical protein IT239_03175, partial [Bacteroidia bacterium]|nr:hypothetical protein [Bacteroidia bacterium]